MKNSAHFQRTVSHAFLALPAADGFSLAGGSALLAHRVIDRTTRDIDLFGEPNADVSAAHSAFLELAELHGWRVEEITQTDSFVRLVVSHGEQKTLVDLAIDTPAPDETVNTTYGRTLSVGDLAGRKLMAIFDRAEARDFADIYRLRSHQTKEEMLAFCSRIDGGFDLGVLAEMFGSLRRFRDHDIPLPPDEIVACRDWFDGWHTELLAPSGE